MYMARTLEQPLISIIVPFYNVEKYLAATLESIVNQIYKNLEILLIDDCSPDGSLAIAQAYAAKDSRIRIMRHGVNTHVGGARNTGLAAARGEYIWFVDSDDTITSIGSVASLVGYAQQYHYPDVISFGLNCYHEDVLHAESHRQVETARQISGAQLEIYLSSDRHYWSSLTECSWDKLWLREFLVRIKAKQLEGIIHEDNIVRYWLFRAKQILMIGEAHYNYRAIRANSSMNSKMPSNYITQRQMYLESAYAFIQEQLRDMDKTFIYDMLYRQIFNGWLQDFLREHWSLAIWQQYQQLVQVFYSNWLTQMGRQHRFCLKPVPPTSYDLASAGALIDALPFMQRRDYEGHLWYYLAADNLPYEQQLHLAQYLPSIMSSLEHSQLQPEPEPEPEPEHPIKKIIKGILPYALTQYLLKKRGWRIHIQRIQQEDSVNKD
jgi:glycosyltransferase involved in cell wall biosynthesis